MCTKNLPTYTSLAIVRILEEYTDEAHAMSISRLRNLLHEVYGIDVSDDTVRKQVRGIIEFCNRPCPRDAAGRKVEAFDTPSLFPQTEVEFLPQGSGAGSRTGVRLVQRPFDDAEVDFMAAAVDAVSGADPAKGGDLMRRIRALEGPEARDEALRAASHGRGGEDGGGLGRPGGVGGPSVGGGSPEARVARGAQIGLTEFAGDLVLLREAIREGRAVSFNLVRYAVRPALGGRELVAEADGARREGVIPCRLECVEGRYCLLGYERGSSRMQAFRVDLMRKLLVDEAEEEPAPSAGRAAHRAGATAGQGKRDQGAASDAPVAEAAAAAAQRSKRTGFRSSAARAASGAFAGLQLSAA